MQKYICTSSHVNRRYVVSFPSLCGLFLALLFLLAACGDSPSTNVPDSQQLLNQARDAMRKVNSYHFSLTTAHPGTGSGISIQTADGDALAPDKIKAKSNVDLQGITAQVNIIAIGQKQYYTDPITGSWTPITGIVDPHVLADPQTGIGTILSNIRKPSKATDSSVAGNSCWSITGLMSSQYIAGITGDSQPTNSDVNTTVCIGKTDHYPYQMQVTGVAIQGDGPQTARTINFSKFNESITIQAP